MLMRLCVKRWCSLLFLRTNPVQPNPQQLGWSFLRPPQNVTVARQPIHCSLSCGNASGPSPISSGLLSSRDWLKWTPQRLCTLDNALCQRWWLMPSCKQCCTGTDHRPDDSCSAEPRRLSAADSGRSLFKAHNGSCASSDLAELIGPVATMVMQEVAVLAGVKTTPGHRGRHGSPCVVSDSVDTSVFAGSIERSLIQHQRTASIDHGVVSEEPGRDSVVPTR